MRPEDVTTLILNALDGMFGHGKDNPLSLVRVPAGLLLVSSEGHHVLVAVSRAEIVAT